jgi:hypothetical protein
VKIPRKILRDFGATGLWLGKVTLMDSSEPQDSLPRVLQEWRVRPPLNPQFRPAVWQRIAQRSRESWAGYVRTHGATWMIASLVVIGVAGWTGHAVAQTKMAADREAMVVAYLVGLDPRVQAKLRP